MSWGEGIYETTGNHGELFLSDTSPSSGTSDPQKYIQTQYDAIKAEQEAEQQYIQAERQRFEEKKKRREEQQARVALKKERDSTFIHIRKVNDSKQSFVKFLFSNYLSGAFDRINKNEYGITRRNEQRVISASEMDRKLIMIVEKTINDCAVTWNPFTGWHYDPIEAYISSCMLDVTHRLGYAFESFSKNFHDNHEETVNKIKDQFKSQGISIVVDILSVFLDVFMARIVPDKFEPNRKVVFEQIERKGKIVTDRNYMVFVKQNIIHNIRVLGGQSSMAFGMNTGLDSISGNVTRWANLPDAENALVSLIHQGLEGMCGQNVLDNINKSIRTMDTILSYLPSEISVFLRAGFCNVHFNNKMELAKAIYSLLNALPCGIGTAVNITNIFLNLIMCLCADMGLKFIEKVYPFHGKYLEDKIEVIHNVLSRSSTNEKRKIISNAISDEMYARIMGIDTFSY